MPPQLVTDYAARCEQDAAASGDADAAGVSLLEIPLAGHYDVVTADATPWLSVWQKALEAEHALVSPS